MNEALEVDGAALRVDGFAVETEFEDVVLGHQPRCHAARHQKAAGILVVANADMAEAIDHALVVENVVGGDDILWPRRAVGPGVRLQLSCTMLG